MKTKETFEKIYKRILGDIGSNSEQTEIDSDYESLLDANKEYSASELELILNTSSKGNEHLQSSHFYRQECLKSYQNQSHY